jgi:N6-adenosine-specific RNA methylase IME4
MWATFPLLPEALEVVKAWGFQYKTAIVWSKQRPNMGHYHTADAELLVIATRGSCTPDVDTRETQVQSIKRVGRHSEKPEAFRELIDRLYPHGRRIELFRRGSTPTGWDAWGNESDAA